MPLEVKLQDVTNAPFIESKAGIREQDDGHGHGNAQLTERQLTKSDSFWAYILSLCWPTTRRDRIEFMTTVMFAMLIFFMLLRPHHLDAMSLSASSSHPSYLRNPDRKCMTTYYLGMLRQRTDAD